MKIDDLVRTTVAGSLDLIRKPQVLIVIGMDDPDFDRFAHQHNMPGGDAAVAQALRELAAHLERKAAAS